MGAAMHVAALETGHVIYWVVDVSRHIYNGFLILSCTGIKVELILLHGRQICMMIHASNKF
jgi:hypothetical protein